jgi:hypothetical protein
MNQIIKKTAETVAKAAKKKAPGISKELLKRVDPTETFRMLIDAYRECANTEQVENTKRAEIRSNERVTLKEIAAKREILMTYLERTFDERRENFAQLFETLDYAIQNGKTELSASTLNSITELGKSSPFKDLASISAMREMLDDPNKQIEF